MLPGRARRCCSCSCCLSLQRSTCGWLLVRRPSPSCMCCAGLSCLCLDPTARHQGFSLCITRDCLTGCVMSATDQPTDYVPTITTFTSSIPTSKGQCLDHSLPLADDGLLCVVPLDPWHWCHSYGLPGPKETVLSNQERLLTQFTAFPLTCSPLCSQGQAARALLQRASAPAHRAKDWHLSSHAKAPLWAVVCCWCQFVPLAPQRL